MVHIAQSLAALSPDKRKLLRLLLKQEKLDISRLPITRAPRDQAAYPLLLLKNGYGLLINLISE